MGKKGLMIVGTVVLLAGSVTAWAYHYGEGWSVDRADRMVERISERLELDAAQRSKLEALKAKLVSLRQEHASKRQDTKEAVLSLLNEPTLDRNRAEALVQERVGRIQSAAPEVIGLFADFYDGLNPDQQKTLRERLAAKFDRSHHRH